MTGAVPGLQQLVPSYLSLDTHSRVVRLDSWSKVLAPGLRLGWVTGHPEVVDLMALALHASLNGPPGISQVRKPDSQEPSLQHLHCIWSVVYCKILQLL